MQNNIPPARFFGVDEVMSTLRCSRATVYRLIDSERLKRVRLGGKALITVISLDALVAELLGNQEDDETA